MELKRALCSSKKLEKGVEFVVLNWDRWSCRELGGIDLPFRNSKGLYKLKRSSKELSEVQQN